MKHPIPDGQRCWFYVHEERACSEPDCTRPVRYGDICALHLAGANCVGRATALLFDGLLGYMQGGVEER